MHYKRIAFLLALLLLLSSCAAAPVSQPGEPANQNAPISATPSDPAPEKPQTISVAVMPKDAAEALTALGVGLLRQVTAPGKNTLVSPLSASLALSMTANGAAGETLAQMESVLGMDLETLNQAAQAWMSSQGRELHLANGIWFRNDPELTLNESFLNTCTDLYQAQAEAVEFNQDTLKKINQWVNQQTDEMIPRLFDQLPDQLALLLVNALAFDAKWAVPYGEYNISPEPFTAEDGTVQTVDMMYSGEERYLDDGNAIGFLKPYEDNRYLFGALLPNGSIDDYLSGLTAEHLQDILNNTQYTDVDAGLPAFTLSDSNSLTDALSALGMTDAFQDNAADLSGMADNDLFISDVLQKTFIDVNADGTKAAAVTAVAVAECAMPIQEPPKVVILNRPFLYFILDAKTNQPLFLGVMRTME